MSDTQELPKEKSDGDKPEAPKPLEGDTGRIKDMLTVVRSFSGLVGGVGLTIVAIYCIKEHIIPDGLSIGDSFLIVFAAIAFGILIGLAALYGVMVSFWLNWLVIKKVCQKSLRSEIDDPFLFWLSLVIFLVSIAIVWYAKCKVPNLDIGYYYAVSFVCGFIINFFIEMTDVSEKQFAGLAVLSCVSVFLIGTPSPLVGSVMELLGVRGSSSQMIFIGEDDHNRLVALLDQAGMDSKIFCQFEKTKQWGTTNALVIWNGVGATSYVSLTGQVKSADKQGGQPNRNDNGPVPSASAASGSASVASTPDQEQPSAGNTSPAGKTSKNTITVPIPSKNLMVIRSTSSIPCKPTT